MVDVNIALSNLAVNFAEFEFAHDACGAVVLNAKLAGRRVAFVGVDTSYANGSLEKITIGCNLLGVAVGDVLK